MLSIYRDFHNDMFAYLIYNLVLFQKDFQPLMVQPIIFYCVFEKPSKEGQLLKIFGYPASIGNTSVTLYIEARAHNVRTGRQAVVLKTHTKFVYIDEDGNPLPLKEKSVKRIKEMLERLETSE